MTQFEERVLRDLSELKAHMRWIVGDGNEGKLHEIEGRLRKHEAVLQKMGGVGAAAGALMTIVHFCFDYLRAVHK